MEKIQFIESFKRRTKKLAVDIILLYDKTRKTDSFRIVGKQVIRSVTSTAANYRAASLSRSKREFYSKMCITVEEADETLFWLEIMEETKMIDSAILKPYQKEALEILKIVSSGRKNAYLEKG